MANTAIIRGTAHTLLAGGSGATAWDPNPNLAYDEGGVQSGSATGCYVPAGADSQTIIIHTIPLNIPANSTINGIIITTVGVQVSGQHTCKLRLYNGTTALGNEKSATLNSGADMTWGANNDVWGATLTTALLNTTAFGFGFKVTAVNSGSVSLYDTEIQVYYTEGAAPSSGPPAIVGII